MDENNLISEQENTGVEEEDLYGPEGCAEISEPFDPRKVDIIPQTMVVSNIIERLRYDEIDMEPDFQRRKGLWTERQQSRLIESLIIKIPLPSFYFDCNDEDKYIVVDGLQRLYSIYRFAVTKELRLKDLEYLNEYEGKSFDELPVQIQRRIRESTITAYLIRRGTPDKVRTSIFTRINTGGLGLTGAEIRNSIYRGRPATLLKTLAHSDEFVKATRGKIKPERMDDCEYVNRFLAFYLLGVKKYKGNLESFFTDVLEHLKQADSAVYDQAGQAFLTSMRRCCELFGDRAFRKIMVNEKYGAINKPLYEVCSVTFALLTEEDYKLILTKHDRFDELYAELLHDELFVKVITNGTATMASVETRYSKLAELIREVLKVD